MDCGNQNFFFLLYGSKIFFNMKCLFCVDVVE